MTRRSSLRAQAQEFYREMVRDADDRDSLTKDTPLPNPLPQGERGPPVQGEGDVPATQTDLTARVRALYEGSAVPVREIARLAGVSERTLYKYVEKHRWQKRYRVLPRGEAVARANRGRGWQPAPGFAPAKGAGGRFIRREDIGRPFATGLKALDPAGHARAVAGCAEAERSAALAEADAELEYWEREKLRAWDAVNRAVHKLLDLREEHKKNPRERCPGDYEMLERAMVATVNAAGDALEATTAEWRRASARLRGLAITPSASSP